MEKQKACIDPSAYQCVINIMFVIMARVITIYTPTLDCGLGTVYDSFHPSLTAGKAKLPNVSASTSNIRRFLSEKKLYFILIMTIEATILNRKNNNMDSIAYLGFILSCPTPKFRSSRKSIAEEFVRTKTESIMVYFELVEITWRQIQFNDRQFLWAYEYNEISTEITR